MPHTDWGQVTLDIKKWLLPISGPGALLKDVFIGTEDQLADVAPKSFPCVFIVFAGAPTTRKTAINVGNFGSIVVPNWELHHYTSTGKDNDKSFLDHHKIVTATRERVMGKCPPSQVNNNMSLFFLGDGRIERVGESSGGLKTVSTYELEQLIQAEVT